MKNSLRLGIEDYLIEYYSVMVTEREFVKGNSPSNRAPHSHDYYELEIITEGGLHTEINGKKYDLSAGTLVLLTPADVHRYIDVIGSKVTLINTSFITKSIEYNPFASSVLSGDNIICHLSDEQMESLLFLMKKIQTETQGDELLNKRYISYLLSCLIIELKRIKAIEGIEEGEVNNEPVRKALIFIRNNFKEQITLEDAAKVMNVSPVYASKLILEYLGYGFKEYLMELRLEYAASLLAYTEENITDIAYYAGYNSVSYFSRGFKKKYGISPAEYRRTQTNR